MKYTILFLMFFCSYSNAFYVSHAAEQERHEQNLAQTQSIYPATGWLTCKPINSTQCNFYIGESEGFPHMPLYKPLSYKDYAQMSFPTKKVVLTGITYNSYRNEVTIYFTFDEGL